MFLRVQLISLIFSNQQVFYQKSDALQHQILIIALTLLIFKMILLRLNVLKILFMVSPPFKQIDLCLQEWKFYTFCGHAFSAICFEIEFMIHFQMVML